MLVTLTLKENGYTFRGGNSVKLVLSPSEKKDCYRRKEFAACGKLTENKVVIMSLFFLEKTV